MNLNQKNTDFLAIQKGFFYDVFKGYLAPVRLVGAIINVPVYLLREMITCMVMDSEDYAKLQEMKSQKEEDLLVSDMGNRGEFENKNM